MLHEQVRAVVHPPVPAMPVELLGRDEVGEPPGIMLTIRLAQRCRASGSQVGDVHAASAHEGNVRAIGADARIDRRTGAVELRRASRRDLDRVRDARDDEGGVRPVAIDAEGGDARRHLAHPLTPRALLGGKIALGEQGGGVDDEPLGTARVLHPQVADQIAPASAANEQDVLAGDGETARAPALEPPGPRLLPGERVGHDGIVPHGRLRDSVGG